MCPYALKLSQFLHHHPPEPGGQGGMGVVRQGLLLPNPGQIQNSTLAGGRQARNSSGKGWQTARWGRDRQEIRFKKKKKKDALVFCRNSQVANSAHTGCSIQPHGGAVRTQAFSRRGDPRVQAFLAVCAGLVALISGFHRGCPEPLGSMGLPTPVSWGLSLTNIPWRF